MLITDLGVFEIDKKGGGGITLVELGEGATLEQIAEFAVRPGGSDFANKTNAVEAEIRRNAGLPQPLSVTTRFRPNCVTASPGDAILIVTC